MFSISAFSTPVFWFLISQYCVFHHCVFDGAVNIGPSLRVQHKPKNEVNVNLNFKVLLKFKNPKHKISNVCDQVTHVTAASHRFTHVVTSSTVAAPGRQDRQVIADQYI